MKTLSALFVKNKIWASTAVKADPDFFVNLSKQQQPEYLWIGCSDSRLPANDFLGMKPGEVFVHRNVANLVLSSDINCLSVIQYAVEVLKVKHVIVCGHYGCGGIKAALDGKQHGLIDNWLLNVKDTIKKHQPIMDSLSNEQQKCDALCELNVKEQVINVCNTPIVQNAWRSGRQLSVHGWIYGIEDGLLKDLDICISNIEDMPQFT